MFIRSAQKANLRPTYARLSFVHVIVGVNFTVVVQKKGLFCVEYTGLDWDLVKIERWES